MATGVFWWQLVLLLVTLIVHPGSPDNNTISSESYVPHEESFGENRFTSISSGGGDNALPRGDVSQASDLTNHHDVVTISKVAANDGVEEPNRFRNGVRANETALSVNKPTVANFAGIIEGVWLKDTPNPLMNSQASVANSRRVGSKPSGRASDPLLIPVEVRILFSDGVQCREEDRPCPDPHQNCSERGFCHCGPGYERTTDPDRTDQNQCRQANGVDLGGDCHDVSNCSYRIHYVTCDDHVCICRTPYVGYEGGHVCYDQAYGWSVAIKTAGITVMVLALGFLVAFAVKACSKSHLRRRVAWLRRSSDVSFRSEDFYAAAAALAVADRPPSYSEEDANKPPSYDEVYPDGFAQGGVDNAAFAPDSPQRAAPLQGRAGQSATELPARSVTSAAPSAPARTHRRGLSGPAALSLFSETPASSRTEDDAAADRAAAGAAAAAAAATTAVTSAGSPTERDKSPHSTGAVPKLASGCAPVDGTQTSSGASGWAENCNAGRIATEIDHDPDCVVAGVFRPAPTRPPVNDSAAEVWHDVEL